MISAKIAGADTLVARMTARPAETAWTTPFASIAATFFWNYGVKNAGAIRAGYFINLIPVFSIVWALVLVGEDVQVYQWVGMLTVCLGLALALIKK